MDDQAVLTFSTTPSPFKVTVDSQPVRPPVSRYGFRIEDTGHMYVIRTPSHILIQWLHSSGLMILEASKASEAQGRGLCGEVGPSWGQGAASWVHPCHPDTSSPVPGKAGTECQARVGIRRAARQRPNVPNVFYSGTETASREMARGSGLGQLSLQAGLSVSFPGGSLIPDNPSSRVCLSTSQSTSTLRSHLLQVIHTIALRGGH